MNPIVRNGNKLRWKFDNVKTLSYDGMDSDKFSIEGVDWKFNICTRTETVKCLAVFLCYESDNKKNKNWICEVNYKLKLLNQTADGKNVADEGNICYREDSDSWGNSELITWDKLMSPENGYLNDDSVVIEIDFDSKYHDFSKKVPNFTDITINVEETDFHLNKGVLCANSEYFYYLLVNKTAEETVIKLDDIKAEDFCYILASLNPFFNGVFNLNFGEIIQVAKKYRVSSLHYKCEQYLLTNTEIELIDKFKYADENGYEKLMKVCIESLKSGADIKLLHANVKFFELKETTKLRIMQRLLEFH